MSLIHIIGCLIVVGVVLYIVGQVPMPAWTRNVINAVAILAIVIWLLEGFGVIGPVPLRLH